MKFAKFLPLFVRYTLVLCLGLTAASQLPGKWTEGDSLPDLAAYNLEGGELPDLNGKVVLVDFWATWCVPCRASFPVMKDLQEEFGEEGFVVLAISVDESAKAFARWQERADASFPVLRDAAQKLVADAAIEAMPTSFLIGRDGRIHSRHSGFHEGETEAAYRAEISALLKAPQP